VQLIPLNVLVDHFLCKNQRGFGSSKIASLYGGKSLLDSSTHSGFATTVMLATLRVYLEVGFSGWGIWHSSLMGVITPLRPNILTNPEKRASPQF